ncbi:unnamed protein product [Mytilus coruscus]|uniref:G-protein coupled receptors family 2 profile 2 domain-containing protein n=1 Tax=Mytilus coruscus TaxID=42192 RepID=A0A6J8BHI8_MYTCO|nr:unnamed protein product [Mytilus coruscus]
MDFQHVLCCMFITTVVSDVSRYRNQRSPSSDFDQTTIIEQQNNEITLDDQVPFSKDISTERMNSANELENENGDRKYQTTPRSNKSPILNDYTSDKISNFRYTTVDAKNEETINCLFSKCKLTQGGGRSAAVFPYETVETTLKANHKEAEISRSFTSELSHINNTPETKSFSNGTDAEITSTVLERTEFLISRERFSTPTKEKLDDELRIQYTTDVDQNKEGEIYTTSPKSEEQMCERLPCSDNRCSCDTLCLLFGDCCQITFDELFHADNDIDIVKILLNTTNAFQSLGYDNSKIEEAEMFAEYGNCHLVEFGNPEYMVIDHCPHDFDNDFILDKCRDILSGDLWDIPVFLNFSQESQITFRNLFCAFCHGYTIKDVSFWQASLHCPESTDVETQLDNEECYVKKVPPLSGPIPRTCSPDRYVTCKLNTLKRSVADVLCSAYVEPVYVFDTYYKNQHCLVCYDVNTTYIIYNCHQVRTYPFDQRPNYPGLDIFFAHDKSGLASEKLGNLFTFNCAEGKIFDFFSMSCQQIVCSKGYKLSKSQCLPAASVLPANYVQVSSIYRLGIAVKMSIVPDTEVSAVFDIFYQLVENVIEKIKQLVPNIELHKEKSQIEYKIYIRFSLNSSGSFFSMTEDLKKIEVIRNSYIKITLENFDNDTSLVGCQNSSLVQLSIIDVRFDEVYNRVIGILPNKKYIDIFYTWFSISLFDNEVQYLAYCRENNAPSTCSLYLQYTSNSFEISNDTITILGQKIEIDNYFIQNGTLFLCAQNKSTSITCSTFIAYNNDEFIYSNDTLVLQGRITVKSTQYFIQNNTLYVCQKDTLSPIYDLINTITDICLVVSLISLVIMITCHMFLKGLNNIHGKNIVNLSMCLFLAQGIFLVCRYVILPHKILPFVSLCEHFLWLCVFSWTVVISTDIAKRMISMSGNISQEKTAGVKRHNRYRLFAFALPFVIVVVCGVLDYQMNYVGYGEAGGSCWISKQEGILFFYIIPVSVALVYSLLCFLLISIQIELARRSSSIATVNNKSRITCGVYFKLFAILGLSWIIGIISSNVEAIALSYVNSIINGLQGFILTVSSLCNRRVLHMIRNNEKHSARRSESRTTITKDTTM